MLQHSDQTRHHAIEIAKIASAAALGYFRGQLGIEFKPDESPVTQADRGVETLVRDYLNKHCPDDGIFGEEHGIDGEDNDHMWVIDPIDGTRSFLSGHPLFGFLLSHTSYGVADIGIIGMPALDEMIIGQKDVGATMNRQDIHVSGQQDLAKAVLYVNDSDKIFRGHPEIFGRLMRAGQTRRQGHDCYPHALVAMGYADAVVDYDLHPYDYLALSVVIETAGGVMTDWQGNPLTLKSGTTHVITAATPELHAAVLEMVNG